MGRNGDRASSNWFLGVRGLSLPGPDSKGDTAGHDQEQQQDNGTFGRANAKEHGAILPYLSWTWVLTCSDPPKLALARQHSREKCRRRLDPSF
jgi:hypothetical protein